jgi:hypothetical protein
MLAHVTGATGTGPTVAVVEAVASELVERLSDRRLPLPLLLACFETAVLECAAPRPQLQYMQGAAAALQQPDERQQQGSSAALAAACPDRWFAGRDGIDTAHGDELARPTFAAVWAAREALKGHQLPWLLRCAQRVSQKYQSFVTLVKLVQPRPDLDGVPLSERLCEHLHRLVLSCCLAARGAPAVDNGGSGGGTAQHTETEVCALAAALAGLCRASGNAQVSRGWLDLLGKGGFPKALCAAVGSLTLSGISTTTCV